MIGLGFLDDGVANGGEAGELTDGGTVAFCCLVDFVTAGFCIDGEIGRVDYTVIC